MSQVRQAKFCLRVVRWFFSGISRFRPTLRLISSKMNKIILMGRKTLIKKKKKKKKKIRCLRHFGVTSPWLPKFIYTQSVLVPLGLRLEIVGLLVKKLFGMKNIFGYALFSRKVKIRMLHCYSNFHDLFSFVIGDLFLPAFTPTS